MLLKMIEKDKLEETPQHRGPVLDESKGHRVIECQLCDFKHLDPIPSDKELSDFYSKQYYNSHKADYISKDVNEDNYWRIDYNNRLSHFQKYTRGRDLIDVGCGSGVFMKYAQENGWNTVGIEPSESAAQFASEQGLQVQNCSLVEFVRTNKALFDVVHLKNVLEHLADPKQQIEICHRLLKPGGILYVEVPNDYDLIQKIGVWLLNERNSWVSVPDHINYFSFKSLSRLLQKTGFKILTRDTTFPMYFFLWLGKNFIANKAIGAEIHTKRMQLEMALESLGLGWLKRGAYKLLAFLGMGRTVILYSVKVQDNT